MDEMIARLNIEHFRKLLREPMDETTRATILQLLAEEEEKLAILEARKKGRASPHRPPFSSGQ